MVLPRIGVNEYLKDLKVTQDGDGYDIPDLEGMPGEVIQGDSRTTHEVTYRTASISHTRVE